MTAEGTAHGSDEARARRVPWLPWIAWAWVALLLVATLAELAGWEDLRLALDFQRHLAGR